MEGKEFTAIVLVVVLFIGCAAAESGQGESLQCSNGKSAIGLTLGVPSSSSWDRKASFFVCLLCSTPKEDNVLPEGDERSHSKFTQEICSFYGDSKRTLIQKFDCVSQEYLSGFRKANTSQSSSLSCSKLTPTTNVSVYESSFPDRGGGSGRWTRANWNQWDIDLNCHRYGQYVCGLETTMASVDNQPLSMSAVCCSLKFSLGLPEKFSSPSTLSTAQVAWIAVLACLVIILALLLICCCVNIWCCRIIPMDCAPCNDKDPYFARKKDESQSQFNTRPNTAVMNNGGGGGGRLKRPSTSTIRKMSVSAVDPVTTTSMRKSSVDPLVIRKASATVDVAET